MFVPDLSHTFDTDRTLPPTCVKAVPYRKPPGSVFLWTLKLVWNVDKDIIADVKLPAPFAADRPAILRSFQGKDNGGDGPYSRTFAPGQEGQATISCRVNTEPVVTLAQAPCICRSMQVDVATNTCKVTALLRVEATREQAREMMDLLDADLDITFTMQESLPFVEGEELPEEKDAPDQLELTNGKVKRSRSRRATATA
jgi:hypothetical protein